MGQARGFEPGIHLKPGSDWGFLSCGRVLGELGCQVVHWDELRQAFVFWSSAFPPGPWAGKSDGNCGSLARIALLGRCVAFGVTVAVPSTNPACRPHAQGAWIMATVERHEVEAFNQWYVKNYAQLRGWAGHLLDTKSDCATWSPTDLLHETWLAMRRSSALHESLDERFLRFAFARALRQTLLQRIRRGKAIKHGGLMKRVCDELALEGRVDHRNPSAEFLTLLNETLEKLGQRELLQQVIFDLVCFAEVEFDQIADHLGLSRSQVLRKFHLAKTWVGMRLDCRLETDPASPQPNPSLGR